MSRRAAEREILAGFVTVNGKKAEIGQKIAPGDRVMYKGKAIVRPASDEHEYIMLNKPRGYITSMSDDLGRRCVRELITEVKTRIYPVGRLDYNSEGLLLLTDDGDLANKLTHPKYEIPKIYKVSVKGKPTPSQLSRLSRPIRDGDDVLTAEVTLVPEEGENSTLLFKIKEGKNREIRRMCDAAGVFVRRLRRVQVGRLSLGSLKAGEYRYLTPSEIRYLKDI
jgi:23S rRNA pseudouridine2605 synthase